MPWAAVTARNCRCDVLRVNGYGRMCVCVCVRASAVVDRMYSRRTTGRRSIPRIKRRGGSLTLVTRGCTWRRGLACPHRPVPCCTPVRARGAGWSTPWQRSRWRCVWRWGCGCFVDGVKSKCERRTKAIGRGADGFRAGGLDVCVDHDAVGWSGEARWHTSQSLGTGFACVPPGSCMPCAVLCVMRLCA